MGRCIEEAKWRDERERGKEVVRGEMERWIREGRNCIDLHVYAY